VLDRVLRKLMPFDAEVLLRRARKQAENDIDIETSLEAALRCLLGDLENEAALKPIGRLIAWNDLKRLLAHRARLADDRQRWPRIAAETVTRPIFITGLPRSGTTLLHGLLASDPQLRAPLTWEVMAPSPPPGVCQPRQLNKRVARARRQLRWFDRLAPGFQAVHEVGAELPQECIAITAYALLSLRFVVTYRLPNYLDYLARADMREAYRYHRTFLQQLQFDRAPLRWVLKAPGHLPCLDALAEVYPDAIVIQTHRDPATTLPSLASLRVAARSAFATDVDREEVGREVTGYWADALQQSMAVRQAGSVEIVDVDYNQLVGDPQTTLERVYQQTGLDWSERDAQRVRAYLARNPQGKHGRHEYRAEDFGLSEAHLSDVFHDYRKRMGWAETESTDHRMYEPHRIKGEE